MRLVILEDAAQVVALAIPNVRAYCLLDSYGNIQYLQECVVKDGCKVCIRPVNKLHQFFFSLMMGLWLVFFFLVLLIFSRSFRLSARIRVCSS